MMRTLIIILTIGFVTSAMSSCDEETTESNSALSEIKATQYFTSEIFSQDDLKIYGKWKIYQISGGIHGNGYQPDFDYLEIKEYGIYGFVRNDTLLEYGKIVPTIQTSNELELKVDFEKDKNSDSFFTDPEKYVVFNGADTLNLISPCCDRFNYHFKRIK